MLRSPSSRQLIIRSAAAAIMLACIIWGYWWFTWCLAIILLFYFRSYYEIILWGVLYDALYGMALPEYWDIRYIFTISSFVLFFIVFFLRKRLIIYDDKN